MRIIAGESKGRVLEPVRGRKIRPTSDRVKESMFNIIQNRIQDSTVLDLFAGTGNLGLEALSRGARRAIFIDRDINAIKSINKNCKSLGYSERTEIFRNDAASSLTHLSKDGILFDIIFMDPPYNKGYEMALLSSIGNLNVLHDLGIIVVEHDAKLLLPDKVVNLYCFDRRKYGGTGISFYRKG